MIGNFICDALMFGFVTSCGVILFGAGLFALNAINNKTGWFSRFSEYMFSDEEGK